MKANRDRSARTAARAEQGLYRAILSLRTEAECEQFFADLCTPAELEALVDRWAVVKYLQDGLPYRKIHELTGVSVTTIGRVARFLIARQRRLSDGVEAPVAALETGDLAMRITTDARIKIAVQKSGRLTEHSLELLVRCGLSYSRGKDQLICYGENMPVDVLLVRDDDIPRLVQEDICDLGIVGLEHHRGAAARASSSRARRSCSRRSAGSTSASAGCRSACRPACRYGGPKSLQGKRIATTYPRILARLSAAQRRRGADRRVLRRRRDRAEPRQGRSRFATSSRAARRCARTSSTKPRRFSRAARR